ncbi:MAG: hypothetical protein AMXMBFR16_11060 [Candidatus Uhrbacteria bacterium]
MRVLLPFASFKESAGILAAKDVSRILLGILRVLKTLKQLEYDAIAINRHPQKRWLKLWYKNEGALAAYGLHLIEATTSTLRHFNGAAEFLHSEWDAAKVRNGNNKKPEWVYKNDILESHRQFLVMQQEKDRLRTEFKRARNGSNRSVRISGLLLDCETLTEFVTRTTGSRNMEELTSGRVARAREHLRSCVTSGRSAVLTRTNSYADLWGGASSCNLAFPED